MPRRQVVKARDAREADLVEHLRELAERAREVLVLEPQPHVQRAASARPTRGGAEASLPPRERIGVIVEIERAEPEELLRLVVDADRDDRAVGREVRLDDLCDRREPCPHVRVELLLAYDGTGHARGGDGIHAGVPCAVRACTAGSASDPVGNAKARQLRVDVRARPQHDAEPGGASRSRKRGEIVRAAPQSIVAGRSLVDRATARRSRRVSGPRVDRARDTPPIASAARASSASRPRRTGRVPPADDQPAVVEPGAAMCFHALSSSTKRLGPRAHAG